MSTIKTTHSAEFFEEVSTRFVKVVIQTHILAKGFQFIRIENQGEEKDGLYLLYKDIVIDNNSFWVGYKVVDEENNKINFNKPIWVHFNVDLSKKKPKIISVEIIPIANFVGAKNYQQIDINLEADDGKLELIKRGLFSVSKNITEFYTKARFNSYIKVITQFVNFDYDFEKSEVFGNEQEANEGGELLLKTRYMPILFKTKAGNISGIAVFIENIKFANRNMGVWYCAPLKDERIDTKQGFLASAISSKSLNVNTVLNDKLEPSFCGYDIQEDMSSDTNFLLNVAIRDWLQVNIEKLKISNLDIENEINQAFNKIEKQKDIFMSNVIDNIYFKALEKGKEVPILKISEGLIEYSRKEPVKIGVETPAIPETAETSSAPIEATNDESLVIFSEVSLIDEFTEGFNYSFSKGKVVFKAKDSACEITVSKGDVENNSNQVFNELLRLRIDPFVVLQMFKEAGVVFKQYSYTDLKNMLENASEEDLKKYIGFENYFAAVRAEQNKRKKQKLMLVN